MPNRYSPKLKPTTYPVSAQQEMMDAERFRQYEHQMYMGVKPSGPPPASGLGNPGPLGLAGFAMTTMVLSVFNTGCLIDARLEGVVMPLAFFYGGIAQFIAGLFEFLVPNTFGATAFCSYGAFWVSFGYFSTNIASTLPGETVNHAVGLFLLMWTIFTLYMTPASFRVSRGLFALFVFLSITFIFLTAGAFSNNTRVTAVGGWFGLITAGIAWYCSFAVVFNNTWGKAYIPIGVYTPMLPAMATTTKGATSSGILG